MTQPITSPFAWKVDLVLDPEFGDRIFDLTQTRHIWVVDSSTNTPAIERFWKETGPDLDAPGLTSFDPEGQPLDELCADVVQSIDEHHGVHAHDGPWTEIEVHGAPLNEYLRNVCQDFGATTFEPTADGFVARR